MTTLPHGTTIEIFNQYGKKSYRICRKGGGLCRITQNEYQANEFAELFEEYATC